MKRYTKQVSWAKTFQVSSSNILVTLTTDRQAQSGEYPACPLESRSDHHRQQWTGERFFKEGKTELSSEFVEYEKDIELRKKGIERWVSTLQSVTIDSWLIIWSAFMPLRFHIMPTSQRRSDRLTPIPLMAPMEKKRSLWVKPWVWWWSRMDRIWFKLALVIDNMPKDWKSLAERGARLPW
jgi:hypothetical protein